MKSRLIASVSLALLIAGAGLAAAQDGTFLKLVDKNSDGKVTAAEIGDSAKAQFSQADTNKDGVLSEAEFVNFRVSYFKQLDTDGDGSITRADMRARFLAGATH